MLLVCAILSLPVALAVFAQLGVVLANNAQARKHPPKQHVLTLDAQAALPGERKVVLKKKLGLPENKSSLAAVLPRCVSEDTETRS